MLYCNVERMDAELDMVYGNSSRLLNSRCFKIYFNYTPLMSFNCILPAIMCMIYRSYMLIQKWKWENDLLHEHFVAIFSVFLVSMSGTSVWYFNASIQHEDEINVKKNKKKKFEK